jgi:hypothetical protein
MQFPAPTVTINDAFTSQTGPTYQRLNGADVWSAIGNSLPTNDSTDLNVLEGQLIDEIAQFADADQPDSAGALLHVTALVRLAVLYESKGNHDNAIALIESAANMRGRSITPPASSYEIFRTASEIA